MRSSLCRCRCQCHDTGPLTGTAQYPHAHKHGLRKNRFCRRPVWPAGVHLYATAMHKTGHHIKQLSGASARDPACQRVGDGPAVKPRRCHPLVQPLIDPPAPAGAAVAVFNRRFGQVQAFHGWFTQALTRPDRIGCWREIISQADGGTSRSDSIKTSLRIALRLSQTGTESAAVFINRLK